MYEMYQIAIKYKKNYTQEYEVVSSYTELDKPREPCVEYYSQDIEAITKEYYNAEEFKKLIIKYNITVKKYLFWHYLFTNIKDANNFLEEIIYPIEIIRRLK